jgi:hypothetical protein
LVDLTKKAREQADHMELNEITTNFSREFSAFNLDSMLDNGEEDGVGKTHAIPAAATHSVNATTSSSYNNEQSVS